MSRIFKVIFGIIIFIVIILVIIFSAKSNQEQNIKLGFIGPLSGGPALWGQGSLNVAKIAIEEINQKGISGKKIQLLVEDGKCDSQQAVSAFNKLKAQGIKFILGGHCSPETIPIVPLADSEQIFIIASVTAADDAVSASDFAFRTTPPTLELSRIIAQEAFINRDYKNIITFTESASYAKSITSDIIAAFEKLGGHVLAQEEYTPNSSDLRVQLIKIKNQKPDAIFASPQNPEAAINILTQMKELEMLDIKLFGNSIFISESNAKNSQLLPPDAFSVVTYTDLKNTNFINLNTKYQARYDEEIPYNPYDIGANYDAVYMLAEAIESCGEDTTCVKDWFANLKNWPGAVGIYTFKDNGDPIFNNWAILTIQSGKSIFEEVK